MNSLQTHNSSDISSTLRDFMGAMQRLFKIGIYYPKGHVTLDQATVRFMAQLATVACNSPSVTFEDLGNKLLLEGIELNTKIPFVLEFKSILTALGISTIIIDRGITVSDLHLFVRKMVSYKSEINNIKEFSIFEVSGFPRSITIKKKEFLAHKNTSISDERSGEATEDLETLYQHLTELGLHQQEIDQCKLLLDSLPEQLAAAPPTGDENLPSISWEDIARLLTNAITKDSSSSSSMKDMAATRSSVHALLSVLKKLEFQAENSKFRETINVLASIFRKPLLLEEKNKSEKKTPPPRPSDKPNLTISQIQGYVNKNRAKPETLARIPKSSRDNEMLSILLQLAQHNQPLQNQLRMQQFFSEILSGAIPEKTLDILCSGLLDIIRQENVTLITLVIRQLVEIFRNSKHGNSLKFFLLTVNKGNQDDGAILWPFIVSELLVQGSGIDPQSYQPLCQIAARLPIDEMSSRLPQLQSLEAFQVGIIAPDIFHNINPHCYPLFAFLLNTDIEQYLEDRILGGLRRQPADWLIKAIVPLLDLTRQEHKLFLLSYLRQASHSLITSSMKNVAAKIISKTLPTLSQDRRGEIWVHNTVLALAKLPGTETRNLLKSIASRKRLFFISDWPAECRKAAQKALLAAK